MFKKIALWHNVKYLRMKDFSSNFYTKIFTVYFISHFEVHWFLVGKHRHEEVRKSVIFFQRVSDEH